MDFAMRLVVTVTALAFLAMVVTAAKLMSELSY